MVRPLRMIALTCFAVCLTITNSHSRANEDKKPVAAPEAKLTKAQFNKVKEGMTLSEVMALLGRRAEINPDPAPLGYKAPEVLVLWRDGKVWNRWAVVIFVPDKQGVLRAFDDDFFKGGNRGSSELPD